MEEKEEYFWGTECESGQKGKKAVRLKEPEREIENGGKKGGMLPEEMMKPKNGCQKRKAGRYGAKDGGKNRKTDC